MKTIVETGQTPVGQRARRRWRSSRTMLSAAACVLGVLIAALMVMSSGANEVGAATTSTTDLALNKPATASSVESSKYPASYAFDGKSGTRWGSQFSDPQWIRVDLGQSYSIGRVKLTWETAYGKAYKIQVSNDASNWTTVYSTTTGDGGTDDISLSGTGRYVRMYGTARGTAWGYSLFGFEVYGSSVAPAGTAVPAATATSVPATATAVPATATALPATATPAPTSATSGTPKASSIVDDFNDNSINSTLWRVGSFGTSGGNAVNVAETNGQLQIAPPVNQAAYNGYTSQKSYDLTGSAAYVQAVQATGPNNTSESLFQLTMDGNNRVEMMASGTSLKARVLVAGTMTTVASTSYSSATKWWRIRHDASSDTVYWDTSADGVNWTSMASRKRDFAINSLAVSLQAGTWGSDANPGKAIFDNVNTAGSSTAPVATSTPAPTATPAPTPSPVPTASTGSMSAPSGYSNLVFNDKFTGSSLDSSKWIAEMADGYGVWRDNGKLPAPYSAVGNEGGYNAEYGDPAMVSTGSGLTLGATRSSQFSGYSWKAGYATTHGKFYFNGGYIQVKAKMPDSRSGGWAGIWFLEGGGEIDLQEAGYTALGSGDVVNRVIASNLHTSGNSQKFYDTGVDLSADYHVYGMEYVPGNRIVMYFDGKEFARYTSNVPTGGYEIILTNTMAQNASGWHTLISSSTPNSLPMNVAEVQVWK